jgi:hypothetical protein
MEIDCTIGKIDINKVSVRSVPLESISMANIAKAIKFYMNKKVYKENEEDILDGYITSAGDDIKVVFYNPLLETEKLVLGQIMLTFGVLTQELVDAVRISINAQGAFAVNFTPINTGYGQAGGFGERGFGGVF